MDRAAPPDVACNQVAVIRVLRLFARDFERGFGADEIAVIDRQLANARLRALIVLEYKDVVFRGHAYRGFGLDIRKVQGGIVEVVVGAMDDVPLAGLLRRELRRLAAEECGAK